MENIRIQDNLYTYVNQKTLDELVIPDDKPTAGGFAKLADGVEKIMMGEFEAMTESKSYPNDYLKRACELYAIAKDADRKAAHGITPALKNLSIINEINSLEDFGRVYKKLLARGIPVPFDLGADTDMKNTKQRLAYLQGARYSSRRDILQTRDGGSKRAAHWSLDKRNKDAYDKNRPLSRGSGKIRWRHSRLRRNPCRSR